MEKLLYLAVSVQSALYRRCSIHKVPGAGLGIDCTGNFCCRRRICQRIPYRTVENIVL